MDTEEICLSGKIWDLHIHSCKCDSSLGDVKKLSIDEYITSLISVFDKHPELDLISFTDHNSLSYELYEAYYSRTPRVVLIPGVEVDVCLEDSGVSKHVLIYFDAINNDKELQHLSKEINSFVQQNNIGPRKPIDISKLLNKLISTKIRFVVSPHAMKQGKRGIESDWHTLSADEQIAQADKHMDQFFCFWETGRSGVAHAVEYLTEMDRDESQSIVSFSDSKSIADVKNFLNNPPQFFRALPCFNGLTMVGSEVMRIRKSPETIKNDDFGKYLGEITFDECQIPLSPRMNAIIGGRGTGKSILLDSIAYSLDQEKIPQGKRAEYIGSHEVTIKNMHGDPIKESSFAIDYFNQNYISKLFEKEEEDFNKEVENYFRDAFANVKPFDTSSIEAQIKENFKASLSESSFKVDKHENIAGLATKFIIKNNDGLDIGVEESNKDDVAEALQDFDYTKVKSSVDETFKKIIPPFLKDNSIIKSKLRELEKIIAEQAYECRCNYLNTSFLKNTLISTLAGKKLEMSEAQKVRAAVLRNVESAINEKIVPYVERVALVNAYIRMSKGFIGHRERTFEANGKRENAFQFVRSVDIEHPLEHLLALICDHMKVIRKVGQCDITKLWDYIQAYCFNTGSYQSKSTAESITSELKKCNLRITERSLIRYLDDNGNYKDISVLSPGTQTNLLLEYIVHKDTETPLLIDQPEDNVDNKTIYRDIREWFKVLKAKRQIIVVTHDANIVINADAENVIIASHPESKKFEYECGALEFGRTIDTASLILDGGKEAVRKRLIKYGR